MTTTTHRNHRSRRFVIAALLGSLLVALGAVPASARPLASTNGSTAAPAEPRVELVHVPPPAALPGRSLDLDFAYRSDCALFCSQPIGRLEIDGAGPLHLPVTRTGSHSAGVLRTAVPAELVLGDVVRYRFSVSQERCYIFPSTCETGRATTGWIDVAVLGASDVGAAPQTSAPSLTVPTSRSTDADRHDAGLLEGLARLG